MSESRIFITGASSGIGRALAQEYAAPGVTLGLTARRKEMLEALGREVEARGARALLYPLDVRDAAGMEAAASAFVEAAGGVDLAIANAGIRAGGGLKDGRAEAMADVFAVNVAGVLHTLVPMVPPMIRQGHGRLVAIGSVAGFRGLPGRADYNASKAAVKTLMDGFRVELRPHGIQVTTICPGWVESEMSARNPFPMPFMLRADKAARMIAGAIRGGRKTYILPWQWRLMLPLIVRLPERLLPNPR